MFAVIRVLISPQFLASQDAVFNKSFSSKRATLAVNADYGKQSSTVSDLIDTSGLSSEDAHSTLKKSSSAVNGHDPERSFTITHLNDTCGLSSKDALSMSKKLSSAVNGDDPKRAFTISYLINNCGLSFKDAFSVSRKITIKSPQNPDSVLKLLRRYGFTDAHIHKIIIKWPRVLLASPVKTLLPKLEFFRSIGVPLDVLAQKLSTYPTILQRSLEKYLIPVYDYLKDLLQSDKRIVCVFTRAPGAFEQSWLKLFPIGIATLRERGIPESSITTLLVEQPSVLTRSAKSLTSYIDKAAEMGFDKSKVSFIHAVQTFASMSESTLEHKKEVYRRCGWSESDISLAFRKYPHCLKLSEKKIMDTMDFLVNDLGLHPVSVAQRPILLCFNVDRKMKPRYLVAIVLKEKGLFKKQISADYFFKLSEEMFLKKYVVKYQEHVPELLDIYRGKLTVSDKEFSQRPILR